jgi:outer membrane protein assembly factor BamB
MKQRSAPGDLNEVKMKFPLYLAIGSNARCPYRRWLVRASVLIIAGLVVSASSLFFARSALAQTDPLSQPFTQRWKVNQIEGLAVAGQAGSDRAYVVTEGGSLVAVRLVDGKLLWRSELGGQIGSIPVAADSGVFLTSEAALVKSATVRSGQVRQLSQQSGLTVWSTPLSSPWVAAIAFSPASLYGCSREGRVQAVNRSDGRILWTAERQIQCAIAPVTDQNHVFVADARGDLVAINQTNGALMWRFRTKNPGLKNLSSDATSVYAASADGAVYAIERDSGDLRWSARAGAGTQHMGATTQGVLVTSLDNFVYCLSVRNGQRRWKFKLDGRPIADPVISERSVLLLSSAGDEGVVLDLRSGKPINRLSFESGTEPTGSPLQVDDYLIIPTRQGLIAFASNAAPVK